MTYKDWIFNQECLIAGYWGSEQVDLMSAVAVYAIAKCEQIQVDRAMYALFPDYYYNLRFAHTEDKNFVYERMCEQFSACDNRLVLFRGKRYVEGKIKSIPIMNATIIAELQTSISSRLVPQSSAERQILQDAAPGQHLNWLQQRAEAQALIEQAIEVLSRCL